MSEESIEPFEAIEREIADLRAMPRAARVIAIERLCAAHPDLVDVIRALASLNESLESEIEAPTHIGAYRTIRVLGEGGMGMVVLAEQQQPVRRHVAIKLIKLGMDTKQIIARFEAERQALAVMSHSAIAKVFDAGITEQGRPYFVMEYVDGISISRFCDESHASLHERLELFRQVCSGVQHAHQKGVIHRDLKPSNILVTLEDGLPTVKIIDFGLARATGKREVEATLFTQAGQLLGTPVYMSPEQAVATNLDIDTRTDVYSLGVVLYELLAGALPFDLDDVRGDVDELRRKIQHDDPVRPSTKVDRTETADSELRRSWIPSLRGDLDWIVMKALAKEPERRYATIAELSADIGRYLASEPVHARPPGSTYRLRRLVRKHRVLFASGALVLAVLLAGVAVSIWFAFGESSARATAESHLANFDDLAVRIKLDDARAREAALDPAWPEQRAAIEHWLVEFGVPLRDALPQLHDTVGELRSRALPWTDEERAADRATHPNLPDLVAKQSELRWRADSAAVRAGDAEVPNVALDEQTLGAPAEQLFERAIALVGPARTEFGSAPEALALLREYMARTTRGTREKGVSMLIAMVWAALDAGDDALARDSLERASQMARGSNMATSVEKVARYADTFVELASGPAWRARIDELEGEVADLELEVSRRRTYSFEQTRDRFLHDTLVELIQDLERFVAEEFERTEARLRWCDRLDESMDRFAQRWAEARDAIAAADGIAAHEAYANPAIDLAPQPGLVPIGMNPATKLWEFYDLRTATDPESIPTFGPDGSLVVDGDTGIVFVLVPGGQARVGEQSKREDWPNYSPDVAADEGMCVGDIEAFLLSRFELSQGQWTRLTGGDSPAFHGEGSSSRLALPVEQVDWNDCDRWLRRFGMELPTEAQWEHACRAATGSRWSTGVSATSLEGFANLDGNLFADAHATVAPIGSYTANGFGLHDMHGNVSEWCRDTYFANKHKLRVADGLRRDGPGPRVFRGGSYADDAERARCAKRGVAGPQVATPELGVRPARELR